MRVTDCRVWTLGLALMMAAPLVAQTPMRRMEPAPATAAQVIARQLASTGREIVAAAEAMPADKYNFAPPDRDGNFAGVRTFAQQVKHLAVSNYSYGAAILGQKPPVASGANENGPADLTNKDAIVKLLRDSFNYAVSAVNNIRPDQQLQAARPGTRANSSRLATATAIAPHAMDHYGQMVEYLRMNGLTPPASATSAPANPKKK
ncbi:MAG: DinB family protein [Terriglobales bacterium]